MFRSLFLLCTIAFLATNATASPVSVKTRTGLDTLPPFVHIMDTAFYMPQLQRHRKIWIFLPPAYGRLQKQYPVLYLQDGQNLFDAATSFAGEWGADEAMGSIRHQWIMVGIENGGAKRMTEYNPNDHQKFGKGEGKAYLEFIIHTLKPYIDSHYRTKSDAKHTAIAGSSMGGLVSFYAGIGYPQNFGKIGVFSPSFWIAPELADSLFRLPVTKSLKKQDYFFYAGKKESDKMVSDCKRIAELLGQKTGKTYTMLVSEEGKHQEAAWRKVLPDFFRWLNQ